MPRLSVFCERISHVFSPMRMGTAQHAFTVSTGEPVGMGGAGTVGVLWGWPKDDGVPMIGTRSVLFLTARRDPWSGRCKGPGCGACSARPRSCVGEARRRRVEGEPGGAGVARGGRCAGARGGTGGGGGGKSGWVRIRERGIPDEVAPSDVSSHCTVKVRRL